jgi:hypothetical protein
VYCLGKGLDGFFILEPAVRAKVIQEIFEAVAPRFVALVVIVVDVDVRSLVVFLLFNLKIAAIAEAFPFFNAGILHCADLLPLFAGTIVRSSRPSPNESADPKKNNVNHELEMGIMLKLSIPVTV